MTTVAAALTRAIERLSTAGCEYADADAQILLAHVLGTTRSDVRASTRRELDNAALEQLNRLVARREGREPLAYVLGEWGFRRLTLEVDARVLVPRPETEIVVERCLARIDGITEPRVLDVGTGSGAIALAIADEAVGARVTAIDASQDALEVARANASRTGLTVELVHHDLFHGLPEGRWDLVVSNPPYVREDEIATLEPEVRDWEPRAALVGEGATEAVARGAFTVLRPGGALVLETGEGDAARVHGLLVALGYEGVRTTKDLARRDRVVEGGARAMTRVEEAMAAIRDGKVVVFPTDTVYGLGCTPHRAEAVQALSVLKGRSPEQPIAIVASSIESLVECFPELSEEALARARRLLPGPYTLVFPNPARRFPWLSGAEPETIGVRVPELAGPARDLLEAVGCVAATSANLHGDPDPRRLDDVPEELRQAAAVILDGGDLPGTPSTVLDLTGPEPRVLREGAVPAAEALSLAE